MGKIVFTTLAVGLFWLFSSNTAMTQSLARSVIGSAGSSVEGSNLQIAFSVGEVATIPLESPSITLTQGFHQSERIITGIDEAPISVSFRVYPNPFNETLEISVEGEVLSFHMALYDAVGRSLKGFGRRVETYGYWQESVDLTHHPPGIYTLLITNLRGTWAKTYKVMKQ